MEISFRNYTKQWNDKANTWANAPLHNEWSNPADAIRYMCQSLPSLLVANTSTKTNHKSNSSGYDI